MCFAARIYHAMPAPRKNVKHAVLASWKPPARNRFTIYLQTSSNVLIEFISCRVLFDLIENGNPCKDCKQSVVKTTINSLIADGNLLRRAARVLTLLLFYMEFPCLFVQENPP